MKIFAICMTPFYAMAYFIAHTLKLPDREDMPTLHEWVSEIKEL